MKSRKKPRAGFAVCVNKDGYPASLERNKVYRVLPDVRAGKDGYVRIIDESGEDYLYPSNYFLMLALPSAQAETLSHSVAQAAG